MERNNAALAILALCIACSVLLYTYSIGGEQFVFLTDVLPVVFSGLAVIIGIVAVHKYSVHSLHGKSLLFLVVGTASWFVADTVWLCSNQTYLLVEGLRLFAYVPFTLGFFYILQTFNPHIREKKTRLALVVGGFVAFAALYLTILPVILDGQSLLDSVTINGFIVADFALLFGIVLMVEAAYRFRGGMLSTAWIIMALAFVSVFVFDIYFAFNYASFHFGHWSELLYLINYLLLAYGFFYHVELLRQLEQSVQPKRRKKKTAKTKKWPLYSIVITIAFVTLAWYHLSHEHEQAPVVTPPSFAPEFREDVDVVFAAGLINELFKDFREASTERLYCLMGEQRGTTYYVSELTKEAFVYATDDQIVYEQDPPCQQANSIGSLHTHPYPASCEPSQDDLFTWGEMKNPEPLINAILCADVLYIMRMPGKQEGLDFRRVPWSVESAFP